MARLYFTVVPQCPEFSGVPTRYTNGDDLYPDDLDEADISSVEVMLNCSIRVWDPGTSDYIDQGVRVDGRPAGYISTLTVRKALDISPYNLFNMLNIFNIHGPTWGSTFSAITTLKNVVIKLGL